MRHLIENTVTGELQEIENFDPDTLGPDEVSRGEIPKGVPPGMAIWTGSLIISDLDRARQAKLQGVKARREVSEFGGVASPFGPLDTDAVSQRKISGAVVMAMIAGAAFTIDWRMKDNSVVALDNTQMITAGVLVGQHVSAAQNRKNELDALIASAGTLAELDAIDIETGWPT